MDLHISTFILQMANFLLLVFLLKRFFWKPVSEYMNKRADLIANSLNEAESKRKEAETLLAEYEDKIRGYEEEARAILARAERQGMEKREQVIAQAKDEVRKIKSQADWEIKQNQAQAEDDLKARVADLAVLAATQIIGENMDSSLNRVLVEKFLDKVGEVDVH